jgi:hypothetical protein
MTDDAAARAVVAGWAACDGTDCRPETWPADPGVDPCLVVRIAAYGAAQRAAEREACAQVAETITNSRGLGNSYRIAAAIRTRGEAAALRQRDGKGGTA